MSKEKLRIGTITKTHGLKGGVRVFPTTDNPERFVSGTTVMIRTKTEDIQVTIRSASLFKKVFIIIFEEYSDINQVEAFRGCDILVWKDEEEALKDNEYYVDDLIGMTVVDEMDKVLGELTEVLVTGANDVYVVKDDHREILLPAIKECILQVSTEQKIMHVHLLPGLI